MKTLARLTAIMFIFLGALMIVAGVFFLTRGALQLQPFMPALFGGADLAGVLLPLRLLVGAAMSVQGLILAAVGEALWLLSEITRHGEESTQHLASLAARGSMTIP